MGSHELSRAVDVAASNITVAALAEVSHFACPPPALAKVVTAVCNLLDLSSSQGDACWSVFRRAVRDRSSASFVKRFQEFDKDCLSRGRMAKISALCCQINGDDVSKASKAGAQLFAWVQAVVSYRASVVPGVPVVPPSPKCDEQLLVTSAGTTDLTCNHIASICQRYEALAAGKYGTNLAARYLFELSREVQAALEGARCEGGAREQRVKALEGLAEEWRASFKAIAERPQGITGEVPMTPAAVSARLVEQEAHIRLLEEAVVQARRDAAEAAATHDRALAMHMAAARESAKEGLARHAAQLKALAESQALCLAEERAVRLTVEREGRAHAGGKEKNALAAASLQTALAAAVSTRGFKGLGGGDACFSFLTARCYYCSRFLGHSWMRIRCSRTR